ncbi:hypothetical protein V8C35DRAFT_129952 [Trichoderma chlorosporum]
MWSACRASTLELLVSPMQAHGLVVSRKISMLFCPRTRDCPALERLSPLGCCRGASFRSLLCLLMKPRSRELCHPALRVALSQLATYRVTCVYCNAPSEQTINQRANKHCRKYYPRLHEKRCPISDPETQPPLFSLSRADYLRV